MDATSNFKFKFNIKIVTLNSKEIILIRLKYCLGHEEKTKFIGIKMFYGRFLALFLDGYAEEE